jgi:hypothetical protein
MRLLAGLFGMSLAIGLYTIYGLKFGVKVYWSQHIYTMIEYPLWILIFLQWIRYRLLRLGLIISIPIFIALCIWDILDSSLMATINSYTASLASIAYVALASFELVDLQKFYKGSRELDYRYWILGALLINSAGGLAYFSFFPFFYSWTIYLMFLYLNIFTTILFTIGMIWLGRRHSLPGA